MMGWKLVSQNVIMEELVAKKNENDLFWINLAENQPLSLSVNQRERYNELIYSLYR